MKPLAGRHRLGRSFRPPWTTAVDPLEVELAPVLEPGAASVYAAGDAIPPPTTTIERLVDERIQLTADLCQILWRQHELEAAIRKEAKRCTSSEESRAEILRHCFARARARLGAG